MPPPIVNFDKVIFSYGGTEVLHDVSFTLSKGEIVGLLGPNGAGKTTTLKIIAGMLTPAAGRVSVCGLPLPEQAVEHQAADRLRSRGRGSVREPHRPGVSGTVGTAARVAEETLQARIAEHPRNLRSFLGPRKPPGHIFQRHAAEDPDRRGASAQPGPGSAG